eukprot:15455208-Alexandrium_andersonii.AAC.1
MASCTPGGNRTASAALPAGPEAPHSGESDSSGCHSERASREQRGNVAAWEAESRRQVPEPLLQVLL